MVRYCSALIGQCSQRLVVSVLDDHTGGWEASFELLDQIEKIAVKGDNRTLYNT